MCVATARFTIYIAPGHGRPGRPLTVDAVIDDGSRFGWRLLAANNREVARSTITFPDVPASLEAIGLLQARHRDGVLTAARSGRAEWTWRLRVDSIDLAMSSRAYQRRLQCEAAGALFMDLVTDAEVTWGLNGADAADGRSSTPHQRRTADEAGFDSNATTSLP